MNDRAENDRAEVWIVDSSPIILLGKIRLSYLLGKMSGQLTIPEAVVRDIDTALPEDLGRQALAEIIRNENPIISPAESTLAIEAFRLGRGETAVLSLALNPPGDKTAVVAILDDKRARDAAASLGIRTRGTLGLLIQAKDSGEIEALVPYLHQLRTAGMWLDDARCRIIAHSVGETWA